MIHTEEEIREAFQRLHDTATRRSARPFRSIPADPRQDADLILANAIDELILLRKIVDATAPLLLRTVQASLK
jgi:hypothetical protein